MPSPLILRGYPRAIRVVIGKAFNRESSPEIRLDSQVTEQVKAIGKSRKAAAPKYTRPVDLRPLWHHVIKRTPVWAKQSVRARYDEKRNVTLAVLRNDRMSRSDDLKIS